MSSPGPNASAAALTPYGIRSNGRAIRAPEPGVPLLTNKGRAEPVSELGCGLRADRADRAHDSRQYRCSASARNCSSKLSGTGSKVEVPSYPVDQDRAVFRSTTDLTFLCRLSGLNVAAFPYDMISGMLAAQGRSYAMRPTSRLCSMEVDQTMKGIVFTEFLEMVEQKFSPELVDLIVEEAELPSGGVYTTVGTYNHGEMIRLVTCLSKESGIIPPT